MSNYDESNIIEGTLSQANAAKSIPQDLMLLKMENETIMSAAAMRPRSQKNIVSQLRECVDSFPEAADEAIYAKPVGKETVANCINCGRESVIPYKKDFRCDGCGANQCRDRKEVQRFVEGLSIRAAESIRSIYGYNRLAMQQESLPDGTAKITGTFVDYATGTMTSDTRIVQPTYTDRYKVVQKMTSEKFDLAIKSEKSKLARDIILDSIPNNVKAAYRDMCEKKITERITPEVVARDILPFFAGHGLDQGVLEHVVGRPLSMGWTERDRGTLKKLATALRNGETTANAILAEIDAPLQDDQPASKKARQSPLNDKIGKKDEKPTPEQLFRRCLSEIASMDAKAAAAHIATYDSGDWKDEWHFELNAALEAKGAK